ncbi:MAG: histidine kinase [Bacteroidetes bacterium HGW-Bacteroidetes-22]|nr:MAG: histidine kinase [Bacteroidetes bacterium HGW-Bacteroidetes-22]
MLLTIWLVLAWQILLQLVNDTTYQLFAFKALPYRFAFGMLIYTIITMVYLLLNSLRDIQVKNQRMNELNNLVRDAEINALKAQINPHFLFNSLNSIASLTLTTPGKAREMVVKLSEYMRYVIRRNEREMMALSEEMANINRYLDIEMIRFGDRIEVLNRMAPDCSKARIPNMVLQPVFENAVKHGVYESSETIRIFTRCELTPNELVMVIANNFDPEAKPAKGKGIGLENIRRRLMLQYNRSDLLQYGKIGNLFTVVLTIPQVASINDSKN